MDKITGYLADLHVHVGISENGRWIKIPSTRRLTVRNILETALRRKGLHVIGLIDALSPLVQQDIESLLLSGELRELAGGGCRYKEQLTVLLGGEVETREPSGGLAHSLLFLPALPALRALSKELSFYIKNINMSSQNAHMDVKSLYSMAACHGCSIIPAHVFTPFKSIYGSCAKRLSDLFDGRLPEVAAIELGLSADSFMADRIDEVRVFPYLANSDAHSPDNIGREFTELAIAGQPDYENIFAAIAGRRGAIKALYGLNPALGKYHLTRCANCGKSAPYDREHCVYCGGRIVRGVKERIDEIADRPPAADKCRQVPYIYHLPLAFLPGIGAKTLDKIYLSGYSELEVLYKMPPAGLDVLLGGKAAYTVNCARQGRVSIDAGGAGHYGRILPE